MTPVVDQPLTIVAAGTLTGTGSPQNISQTGEGYLTFSLSPDATGPAYIGGSGVTSANGFPLWKGQSRTVRYRDVSAVYINPSGSDAVGWIVEHE